MSSELIAHSQPSAVTRRVLEDHEQHLNGRLTIASDSFTYCPRAKKTNAKQKTLRKRAEYCFESTVSEKRTH